MSAAFDAVVHRLLIDRVRSGQRRHHSAVRSRRVCQLPLISDSGTCSAKRSTAQPGQRYLNTYTVKCLEEASIEALACARKFSQRLRLRQIDAKLRFANTAVFVLLPASVVTHCINTILVDVSVSSARVFYCSKFLIVVF